MFARWARVRAIRGETGLLCVACLATLFSPCCSPKTPEGEQGETGAVQSPGGALDGVTERTFQLPIGINSIQVHAVPVPDQGRLRFELGLRVESTDGSRHVEYGLTVDHVDPRSSLPLLLVSGDRRMYRIVPNGLTWAQILSSDKPELHVVPERLQGASEEDSWRDLSAGG